MEKFVYKSENGVKVSEKELEHDSLATLVELNDYIEEIEKGIFNHFREGNSPLGFDDILHVDLWNDILILEEGTFIWDYETEEFLSTNKGMEKVPNEVLIKQDSCDGWYEDLVGQTVIVVEEADTDDPELKMYTILTDRPSKCPYKEGKCEEIVASCDVEIINYHEIEPTLV